MEVVRIILSFNRNRKKSGASQRDELIQKTFAGLCVEVQTGPAPFKCPM